MSKSNGSSRPFERMRKRRGPRKIETTLFGEQVWLHKLTPEQLFELEEAKADFAVNDDGDLSTADSMRFAMLLICNAIHDEQGRLVFESDDECQWLITELLTEPAELNRLFDALKMLNPNAFGSVELVEKKSAP